MLGKWEKRIEKEMKKSDVQHLDLKGIISSINDIVVEIYKKQNQVHIESGRDARYETISGYMAIIFLYLGTIIIKKIKLRCGNGIQCILNRVIC